MDAYQEIELPFGGKVYRLRPTFRLIVAIEASTNQSARTLGGKIIRGEVSVTELATVIYVLLRAQSGPSQDEIGDALVRDGSLELGEPLGRFFLDAIRGTAKHREEAASAPGSPPPTAG